MTQKISNIPLHQIEQKESLEIVKSRICDVVVASVQRVITLSSSYPIKAFVIKNLEKLVQLKVTF